MTDKLYSNQEKKHDKVYNTYFLCVHNDIFGREFEDKAELINYVIEGVMNYNQHLDMDKLGVEAKIISKSDDGINCFQLIFKYEEPLVLWNSSTPLAVYNDSKEIGKPIILDFLDDIRYYSVISCRLEEKYLKRGY